MVRRVEAGVGPVKGTEEGQHMDPAEEAREPGPQHVEQARQVPAQAVRVGDELDPVGHDALLVSDPTRIPPAVPPLSRTLWARARPRIRRAFTCG